MPALVQEIQGSAKILPWSGDTNQRRRTRRYLLNEVVEGLVVTQEHTGATTGFDVSAGRAYINGTLVNIAAIDNQTTGPAAAPGAGYIRFDNIALLKNGTVTYTLGTIGATRADAINTATVNTAADLASSILLALELRTAFNNHIRNVGAGTAPFHKAVSPHVITTAVTTASTLAEVIVFANALKVIYNDHIGDFDLHGIGDPVAADTVTTVNASDQTTLNTLLNGIKTAWALHIAETRVHNAAKVAPVTDPDSILLAVVAQVTTNANVDTADIWNGARPRMGLI